MLGQAQGPVVQGPAGAAVTVIPWSDAKPAPVVSMVLVAGYNGCDRASGLTTRVLPVSSFSEKSSWCRSKKQLMFTEKAGCG